MNYGIIHIENEFVKLASLRSFKKKVSACFIYIANIDNLSIIFLPQDLIIQTTMKSKKTWHTPVQSQKQALYKPLIMKFLILFLVPLIIFYANFKGSQAGDSFGSLPDQVTFVVIAAGTVDLLNQTIESLLSSKNIENQSKFIVIYDGNRTEEILKYIKNLDKIANSKYSFEWIITQFIAGQLACIDLAFSKVKTKYAFLSLGNWKYSQDNFIEPAIKAMNSNQKISQVVITPIEGLLEKKVEKLSALDTPFYGFSLLPSVHKIKASRRIPGGFVNLTYNATYGLAASASELFISQIFLQMGYHIHLLNESFAEKILPSNYVYNPYKFNDHYRYVATWIMREDEKYTCRLMLKIEKSLIINRKLYNLKRREVNKLLKLNKQQLNNDYEKYGFSINIQIGSQLDYINAMGKKQYLQIVENYPKTLQYKTKYFKNTRKSQVLQGQMKLKKINTTQGFHKFLQKENTSKFKFSTFNEDALKLGVALLSKPKDPQALEAEYFFYSQQANFQQNTSQSKICVFLSGHHLMPPAKMNNLLQSINRQNYSNYQFVVSVDQNSDYSMNRIFDATSALYPKLNNRLKVALQNQDKLGRTGSHYLRMKQFCRESQIVVSLYSNSTLIGRQVFNVINSAFKDPNNWITFFRPIVLTENLTFTFSEIDIKDKNLRAVGASTDQYLVAFRFEMADLLPISQVLQLKYDLDNEQLRPNFIQSYSNDFHIFSYCQMSGQSRIRYYENYPIYHYNELEIKEQGCHLIKVEWQKMKARVKYPLNRLTSLKDTPTLNTSFSISKQVLDQISSLYENLTKCNQFGPAPINQIQFNVLLQNSLSKMASPAYYLPTNEDIKIQQMPFCFVVEATLEKSISNKIIDSIRKQKYENYTLLVIQQTNAKDFKLERKKKEWVETLHISLPNKSHQSYRHALRELCTKNSLVMFLNQPLTENVVVRLNQLHQRQNSWMTYSITGTFVQINSLYLRVYELVQFNDFDKSNQKYLLQGDQQIITLIILQLCAKFSSHKHYDMIYQGEGSNQIQNAYLRAQKVNKQLYQRSTYQQLLNLEQDYMIDLMKKQGLKKKSQEAQSHQSKPFVNSFIRKNQFFKALEYEQIPYIPDNHYLNQRQFYELQRKFKISEFMPDPKKQLRFCLTIFGRNNTEYGRYWKLLDTIKMQNYENYHIVFMDDNSDDKTLELSMQYFKKINFPAQRLTFIKNNKRVYATYNILNSAFNYCHQDDIQVRFDGDDFMLGRNVFHLFNTFYQRNPQLWLVYTNYKTSDYLYGLARGFNQTQQLMNCFGTYRRAVHFITPITTWKVKLLRAIPLKYHQREPGVWFNTLYDDALQYSFVELATLDRIKYIPYINYLYNVNYGSNDNSNEEKGKDRSLLFSQVMYYDPLYPPMKNLDDSRVKNHQMFAELAKDRKNKVFEQIKY